MTKSAKILLLLTGWFLTISLLHVWLNIGIDKFIGRGSEVSQKRFKVGYLPVT